MTLKQYVLNCLSHASYLIADPQSRIAAVVDPQRDVDQYVADAERAGWNIRHVLLTHFHADFVSGHLELAKRCGATIHLGERAQADYDFEPLRDGGAIELGAGVRLTFLATPGHTPESTCIAVWDSAVVAGRPHAVLTGDTLFCGDVGRPDLLASIGVSADQLARMLYHSLHEKLLRLPDETKVYPAHTAGSMCGKNLSSDTVSTVGAQRRGNYALQAADEAKFVRLVTADQPESPAYFGFDADLNRRRRATLDEALAKSLVPLALERVVELQRGGAQVLDAREPQAFADGHLAGSFNVGLSGKYATFAGTILDRAKPIVLVAEPGREREAAMRLGRIGFDGVVGYLAGGASAFAVGPDLVRRVKRVDAGELARRLAAPRKPRVIDVRTPGEWNVGHLEGAQHLALSQLQRRLDEIPRGEPLAIHCQGGYRSMIAASILLQHGIDDFIELTGGYASWKAAGQPVVAV